LPCPTCSGMKDPSASILMGNILLLNPDRWEMGMRDYYDALADGSDAETEVEYQFKQISYLFR